jgi:hypothetical protein
MGLLVFRCPVCGARIVTGVHTDAGSLAKVRSLSVKVFCAHCNTTHLMMAGHGEVEAMLVLQSPLVRRQVPENKSSFAAATLALLRQQRCRVCKIAWRH